MVYDVANVVRKNDGLRCCNKIPGNNDIFTTGS